MDNDIKTLDEKVDTLIEFMHKIEVHLSYGQKRQEMQCEKINDLVARVGVLEGAESEHKGEIKMLKWLFTAACALGAAVGAVVMFFK